MDTHRDYPNVAAGPDQQHSLGSLKDHHPAAATRSPADTKAPTDQPPAAAAPSPDLSPAEAKEEGGFATPARPGRASPVSFPLGPPSTQGSVSYGGFTPPPLLFDFADRIASTQLEPDFAAQPGQPEEDVVPLLEGEPLADTPSRAPPPPPPYFEDQGLAVSAAATASKDAFPEGAEPFADVDTPVRPFTGLIGRDVEDEEAQNEAEQELLEDVLAAAAGSLAAAALEALAGEEAAIEDEARADDGDIVYDPSGAFSYLTARDYADEPEEEDEQEERGREEAFDQGAVTTTTTTVVATSSFVVAADGREGDDGDQPAIETTTVVVESFTPAGATAAASSEPEIAPFDEQLAAAAATAACLSAAAVAAADAAELAASGDSAAAAAAALTHTAALLLNSLTRGHIPAHTAGEEAVPAIQSKTCAETASASAAVPSSAPACSTPPTTTMGGPVGGATATTATAATAATATDTRGAGAVEWQPYASLPARYKTTVEALRSLASARSMEQHWDAAEHLDVEVSWDVPPIWLQGREPMRLAVWLAKWAATVEINPIMVKMAELDSRRTDLELFQEARILLHRPWWLPATWLLPKHLALLATVKVRISKGPAPDGSSDVVTLIDGYIHNAPKLPTPLRLLNGVFLGYLPAATESFWSPLVGITGLDASYRNWADQHPSIFHKAAVAAQTAAAAAADRAADTLASAADGAAGAVGAAEPGGGSGGGVLGGVKSAAKGAAGAVRDVVLDVAGPVKTGTDAAAGKLTEVAAGRAGGPWRARGSEGDGC